MKDKKIIKCYSCKKNITKQVLEILPKIFEYPARIRNNVVCGECSSKLPKGGNKQWKTKTKCK